VKRTSWVVLAVMLAGGGAVSAAESVLLSGASHLSYSYLNNQPGAAADLVVSTSYRPWSFLAFGLEGALLTPLRTGRRTEGELDVALRATPTLWLIYGDDLKWTYLKLGGGLDNQWRAGGTDTVGVMVAALGFTVAPEELWVYFGLELQGQWEVSGARSNRFLGLGALMGYRF